MEKKEEYIEEIKDIGLELCEVCKIEIIEKDKEIKNNDKFYHRKCLKCIICNDGKVLDEENIRFIQDKIYCKTHALKIKYKGHYLQDNLISLIGIPYYKQLKCQIVKNSMTDLVPKFSLYFPISPQQAKLFIKQGGLKELKNELQNIADKDVDLFIDNYEIGSFFVTFGIILKKMGSKVKNFFTGKDKEKSKLIEKTIELVESKNFACLQNITPNAVSFVNQKSFENIEENKIKIKEFLDKKINKKEDDEISVVSNSTIGSINNKIISEQDEEILMNEVENILIQQEDNLIEEMEIIEKTSKTNNKFEEEYQSALKDSIFEFHKTGLIIVNKDKEYEKYEEGKKSCPNCETKFLYHGTKIEYSSEILPNNFKVGSDCWYGLGIYFSDQLDYARYYWNGWNTKNSNINKIPKIDESFSLIASEVYYDRTKRKQIYNFDYHIKLDHMPNNIEIFDKYKDKIIQKNGIHYVEVSGENTYLIPQNEKPDNKLFIGREYVITYNEQIHPIYGITLQRSEYCIIWHDPNFAGGIFQDELMERKKYAQQMTNFNLYYETNEKDALKLIWRKKYNKIILLSNCGANYAGRNFVDKARKILQFNVMVLFFGCNINHLNWIKDYPNSLFTDVDEFYREYIRNYNEEGLLKLKKNIENYINLMWSQFENYKFKDFQDHLKFPLYEKYKNGGAYSELDCSEFYED